MSINYQIGDVIEVTEIYGFEAIYNNKREIINSHIPNKITKYYGELLEVKTERFYFGNGDYEEYQVAKMKYLDRFDMNNNNRINTHFELINNGRRSTNLHRRNNK